MKKAIKTVLSFALMLAMLVPTTASVFAASGSSHAANDYMIRQKAGCVFNYGRDRQIKDIKTVYDFAGNEFYVAECVPTGYYIYNVETDTIVESSERGVSPYIGYSRDMYYGGPTYYYVMENGTYRHAMDATETLSNDQVQILRQSCQKGFETIETRYQTRDKAISTMVLYASDKTVRHPEFYQNLTHCGYISGGKCGFIALWMLIAYKDKYEDDELMSDSYWETDSTLNSINSTGVTVSSRTVISQKLYELDPKDSTTSMHIHSVAKKYLSEVEKSASHTSFRKPFFTEGTIRSLIDAGNPVILFGNLPMVAVTLYSPNRVYCNNVYPAFVKINASNNNMMIYLRGRYYGVLSASYSRGSCSIYAPSSSINDHVDFSRPDLENDNFNVTLNVPSWALGKLSKVIDIIPITFNILLSTIKVNLSKHSGTLYDNSVVWNHNYSRDLTWTDSSPS